MKVADPGLLLAPWCMVECASVALGQYILSFSTQQMSTEHPCCARYLELEMAAAHTSFCCVLFWDCLLMVGPGCHLQSEYPVIQRGSIWSVSTLPCSEKDLRYFQMVDREPLMPANLHFKRFCYSLRSWCQRRCLTSEIMTTYILQGSVCVRVCIKVYVWACMHAFVHMHEPMWLCVYVHVWEHAHICACVRAHVCMCMCYACL